MTTDLRTETRRIDGRREVLIASGPDTVSFLQGQLSQDIEALAPGDTAWTLLLQPQGKIDAWLRITRRDAEEFCLDVDAGWIDAVLTRLQRFKLRTDCELVVPAWQCVTVIGPDADSVAVSGAELDLLSDFDGVAVRDLFGADVVVDGVAAAEGDAVASMRIEAGVPLMGAELDESTIPAAAGIVERSASFTKGCYTGQELVARIDSRGNNVPRRLQGLVIIDGAAPAVGDEVLHDGAVVGSVTSVATSPRFERTVALGYVGRAVETGAVVAVGAGASEALVADLPMRPAAT